MDRRKTVAVIGSGCAVEGEEAYSVSFAIGKGLVGSGIRVITGGLGGVMEAAMRGARSSPSYREGDTIAILPGLDPLDANSYADIVIPTGMGIGRNFIVTNADGIIAVGGGSGTLSEMALSWQKGKPMIALDITGWSRELSGKHLDGRRPERPVIPASGPEEAVRKMVIELRKRDG